MMSVPADHSEEYKAGVLSPLGLRHLDEAHDYGAASSMNWLLSTIELLRTIARERGVKLLTADSQATFMDAVKFEAWCRSRFPDAY